LESSKVGLDTLPISMVDLGILERKENDSLSNTWIPIH